jgi:hypothetical protein
MSPETEDAKGTPRRSEAATTSLYVVADPTLYEWRIPVRATEARCAKIPAIVMVIRFTHVRF